MPSGLSPAPCPGHPQRGPGLFPARVRSPVPRRGSRAPPAARPGSDSRGSRPVGTCPEVRAPLASPRVLPVGAGGGATPSLHPPPPRCSRSAAAGRLGRTLPPAPRPALTVPAAGTIPRAAAAPHRLRSPPPPAARRRRAGAGRGRGPALPRRHRHRLPPPLAVPLPLRLGGRDAGPAAPRGAVPGPAGGRAVRGSGGSIPLPPQPPVSNSSGRHLTGGAGTGTAPRQAPGPQPAPDETPPLAGAAPRIGTGIRTSPRARRETRTAPAPAPGPARNQRADGAPQDGPPDGRPDSALPAARTHGQSPGTELSPSPGAAGGGDRAPRAGWPQPHGVGGSPAEPPHSQQPRGDPSHSGTPREGRPVGSGGGERGPSLRRVPRTRAASGHRVPRVRVRRRSPSARGPLPPPAPCLPPPGPPQARGTWGPAGEPSRARASPYVTAQGPPRPSRGSRVLLANVPNPRAASARPRFTRAPRAGASRRDAARPRPRLLGLSRVGMTAPLPPAASPVGQCEG